MRLLTVPLKRRTNLLERIYTVEKGKVVPK